MNFVYLSIIKISKKMRIKSENEEQPLVVIEFII